MTEKSANTRIRLLHFADIHVGIENYGSIDASTGVNARVLDFLHRFDELIDYGLQRHVDLVIFAGDAYKERSPSPTYQRAFATRVKRLADAGVPVVLLVGNHDLPAMTQKATAVDIFSTLDVPNVIVGRNYELHTVETPSGSVQVATVPYPIRQRLLIEDAYRGLSLEELDKELQRIVTSTIGDLRDSLDPDLPSVLAAHLSVSDATYGSERSVMLGRDAVVSKSALDDPAWDYVALGHVHKHQSLNDHHQPPIVYAGSLERVDFGEERDAKGFCWVELPGPGSTDDTTWEFVEVDARRFVTIRADLRQAEDPLEALQQAVAREDIRDAVVRLILRIEASHESALRDYDVRALLSEAFAIAGISREVERRARVRLGDQTPEEMTDRQLLKAFLEISDASPERTAKLMNHADSIFHWEEEN